MVTKMFVVSSVNSAEKNGSDGFRENVDIEEAIDLTGRGRYNRILLLSCCVIHLGSVMDMLGYSIIVPAASCDLQLTLEQSGMLTSVAFVGFLFAVPWGYTADTRGRRKALLLSSSVGFIISCLTSFSTSFYMMLTLKFLASSFSSASLTLTSTYLGECTPQKYRSKYLFIQNVYALGSDFACFGVAYFLLPLDFRIPLPYIETFRPWRLLTLVMTIPLGLGAIMITFLHESPKFLANLGETDKALDILRIMYAANNGKDGVYPVKSLLQKQKPERTPFWESVKMQTVPIFRPPLLWRTLQLFLLLSICCATNNVFYMWYPAMVNSFFRTELQDSTFCQKITANITHDLEAETCIDSTPIYTIYCGLLLSLFFTVLTMAAVPLANWRRSFMIVTFIISGLSCILVDLVEQPIANMVLFVLIQMTGLCIGNVGSFYVDLFPTSYRGLATSLGMMFTRAVCLAGVNIIGATIIQYCRVTFYGWSIFVFSGVIAALFLPKESKRES